MLAKLSFIIIALLLIAAPGRGDAQMMLPTGAETEAAPADPTTPDAVREMVARMSDGEVRALLLQRLDAVAKAQTQADAQGAGVLEFAERATLGVARSIAEAVSRTPDLWDHQLRSFARFHDRLGGMGILFLCAVMAAAVAIGFVAERIFYRLTRRWTRIAGATGERTLRQTAVFLIKRLLADVAGVFVFFVAASTFGPMVGFNLAPVMLGEEAPRILPMVGAYIAGIWWYLIVLPRLAYAIGRFLMSPGDSDLRIITTDDATARFLVFHQTVFIFWVGFSIWIFGFNAMNGVSMDQTRIGFWLNLIGMGYFAIMAWRAREGLTLMMRGGDPDVSATEEWVARLYPRFIVGLVVVTWFLVEVIVTYGMWDLLAGAPQVAMILILSYAPVMDTLIRGLVRHLMPPMTGEGLVAEHAYLAAKRSYIRIGRILAFGLVVVALGKIWGIDFANLATAGVGAQFAGRLIEMIVVVSIGYLVWELVSLWINRKLAAERTASAIDPSRDDPGGEGGGGAGGSRLSTVLPLLLWVMKVAIAVIFGLIALGNVGIDITPLLAGAGIIGLAVGFGAQKLVGDVVSGIFFLVDDAFRIGEYVEVEGTVGTVEKISIRSLQLRHHKGPVHTIPYGEIPKITNYSRDWVIVKLKFTVPFETDPNKVKKLFKQIGKDMQDIPEFAADLLQPFKSQGVFDFDDVGMIIRGKFMAKPGKQFTLRKEIYNRVQTAFNAAGIEFARREVRVAIPGLDGADKLDDEDKAAIAAAASQAAQSMA